MKKILYLTNIEVPYRVRFFNELSKYCELTVVYEREKSRNRDEKWTSTETSRYNKVYLNGRKIGNENTFSLKIFDYIFRKYDKIIIGCYNSPIQILAITVMRIMKIPYLINVDGEVFINDYNIKSLIKKMLLTGASRYLVAGEKAADSLETIALRESFTVYYFSSLIEMEIENYGKMRRNNQRKNTILVIGQYYDYKGIDIALKAACIDRQLRFKFVGMGTRSNLFKRKVESLNATNVEVIPFMQKEELEREFSTCAMLVLPSRRECWGLVINEAAAFGTPIVSTWGSGAAIEFLSSEYSRFLVKPGDEIALYNSIKLLMADENIDDYSEYLKRKSRMYSVEKSVIAHLISFES